MPHLPARSPEGRQPHRGSGADRRARVDHRARARRPYGRRFLRQPGDHHRVKSENRKLRADPVTVELIRNSLLAATEEMKSVLMRTSYNMIIYEALDFTVGLFDRKGDTLSIGLGLPMFIRGMSDTVKTKLQHYGVENLDPGDILLTNAAYIPGSHLN